MIRDLLAIFPLDYKDEHGVLFWSGPKRAPEPLNFDANEEMHINFVFSCANLIAYNLGIS